ncbi:MAG: 16S rRNA (guanine(527)-N(7))-methyltransferase RsmG [Kiritimatiellae bacterium]|nr:16S rRNA (guanine(527)-N(7))-methyltransferase RsmG [Kiritimatiellia bacterium]
MQNIPWPLPNTFRQPDARALSQEELQRLAHYLDLLLTASQQHNLTAITDAETAWNRHILESVALAPALQGLHSLLDLGSGGGLPGIPLAIIHPHLHVTLLEATGKKARFLRETCDTLGLNQVRICAQRAELEGRDPASREQYDGVTCRAVGSLPEILELSMPLLKPGGRLLAIKGRRAEEELASAKKAFRLLGCSLHSLTPLLPDDPNNDSVILTITKNRPTPDRFPRAPGTPKKSPL